MTPAVSAIEAATTTPVVSTADSDLALEVALHPVHHFDFDVAVLFSDILVVPLVTGTATTETIEITMPATAAGFTEVTTEITKAKASVDTPIPVARPLGASGNKLDGIVMSAKTGARARVGVAYAARFQAISMTWKRTTARGCCSWAAFGRGDVCLKASIRAEKR